MRIKVTYEIEVPETDVKPTDAQLREWARFHARDGVGIHETNPLYLHEAEAAHQSFQLEVVRR